MKKNARILDAACGPKMFYFEKSDPRVLFCDNRIFDGYTGFGIHRRKRTVAPDIVCDFTHLPFADNTFRAVVFDPPHLVGESSGYMKIMYGFLTDDWRDVLRKGFGECFRVLKPHGVLIFKWNEVCIKVSTILSLTPEKPVFGHRSGKAANTHWICFVKGKGKRRKADENSNP